MHTVTDWTLCTLQAAGGEVMRRWLLPCASIGMGPHSAGGRSLGESSQWSDARSSHIPGHPGASLNWALGSWRAHNHTQVTRAFVVVAWVAARAVLRRAGTGVQAWAVGLAGAAAGLQ
jgi:hypothetical protein